MKNLVLYFEAGHVSLLNEVRSKLSRKRLSSAHGRFARRDIHQEKFIDGSQDFVFVGISNGTGPNAGLMRLSLPWLNG